MKRPAPGALLLGSNVIELLLPQRRPFLMVDGVVACRMEPVPTLESHRHISSNEPIFGGHFPGLHLWPGTLTLEGLGQSAAILIAILAMRDDAVKSGLDFESALEGLRNLERGFRLHPGFKAADAAALTTRIRAHSGDLAIGASVEAKFLKPVFAGQRLDYRVALTEQFGDKVRFAVEASVAGEPVASGTMVGARVVRPVLPPAAP